MYQRSIIDTPLLRQLVRAGKAGQLAARGVPGGFVLIMRDGIEDQILETQRGRARKFKRLDAVATYLHGLGARSFTVELDQWTAESLGL